MDLGVNRGNKSQWKFEKALSAKYFLTKLKECRITTFKMFIDIKEEVL